MKKIYILLLGVGLVWLGVLSYNLFNISAQQDDLMQMTHQLEKTDLKLNDQLIALQRLESTQNTKNKSEVTSDEAVFDYLPQDLIRQQLLLIEFSLKQQKPYYALEKLIELEGAIHTYPISPALRESLEHATIKDIDLVKQYIVRKDEQNEKIQNLLQKLELELKKEMMNKNLVPAKVQDQYFWQKWISIDSTNIPATQLIQRPLLMKEAQLRLLIAQQFLLEGQYAQYQSEIGEIEILLKELPDQKSKQMLEQLESLKKITVISQPILTTRALID